jgi:hypothetical protein
MRSPEARTVPNTSAYRRPGAQRHTLGPCLRATCGPCGPARTLRGPHRGVSGHCRPRLPEIAADAVSGGSPRLHPRPRRYGVNPSPSGYLASEHTK